MSDDPKKVVIVSGGSRGIGAGLVAAYRRRGWNVVASARTIEPSEDDDLLTVAGDISEARTAGRIIDSALETYGRIDTLVNNAGVFISKPFTDYNADDYASVIGVNLTGFFFLTQGVVTEMVKQGGGHIVNITSTLVDYANSQVPSVLTSLTKGGIAAATRSLAIEYASRGVRVNGVSLGVIRTSTGTPESYDAVAGFQPLGRVGQISDVTDGILFLESSSFITGEIVHIDGGQIAGH
jgi:NAD(P)-dependent dehydrogenase (short-subunit alcohol dehydrogenase family)